MFFQSHKILMDFSCQKRVGHFRSYGHNFHHRFVKFCTQTLEIVDYHCEFFQIFKMNSGFSMKFETLRHSSSIFNYQKRVGHFRSCGHNFYRRFVKFCMQTLKIVDYYCEFFQNFKMNSGFSMKFLT